MEVDEARLDHVDELGDAEPDGRTITAMMEQLAEQAYQLELLRGQVRVVQQEREAATGHANRIQADLSRALEDYRDLNREYEIMERTLLDLRTSNRRHMEYCPNGGPVFISKHGRRWHYTQGCEHIQSREILRIDPCSTCTGARLTI